MSDIEREAFEQWYKREFERRPTITGYESDITWRAWQAARQAPASGEEVAYVAECPGSSILFFERERAEKYATLHRGETKALTYVRTAQDNLPASGEVEPVADWGNRNTDTHAGWVNELLTLADHHDNIPAFARNAMRTIAKGLRDTHPPAKVPEGLVEAVMALDPDDDMFGIDFQDEMSTYACRYCDFDMEFFGTTSEAVERINHDKNCPVQSLRNLLTTPTPATTPQPAQQGSVPEWMSEISENLKTQDNRMTADPMFVVFQKGDIVVDEDYDHDVIVWVDDEGNKADPETVDQLNDMRADMDGVYYMENEIELGDEERQEWRRFAIKETDTFVAACFTEAGAKAYLNRDGHNLKKPFIYATSLYRNEEMKRLRDWLMFATPQPEGNGWIPEMDDDVRWILGRPNFACAGIAQRLRDQGQYIKRKAEDEQAAAIHWMLGLHAKHGRDWKQKAKELLSKPPVEQEGE